MKYKIKYKFYTVGWSEYVPFITLREVKKITIDEDGVYYNDTDDNQFYERDMYSTFKEAQQILIKQQEKENENNLKLIKELKA